MIRVRPGLYLRIRMKGAYSCDVATGVANKSNWVKVGDGAYKIVDWYMMGALVMRA
ncbi:MAG: hypothetical protein K6T94_20355 [Paenibacillus sp.]|nr:hypothetical protein [Paenibacillus sp.]